MFHFWFDLVESIDPKIEKKTHHPSERRGARSSAPSIVTRETRNIIIEPLVDSQFITRRFFVFLEIKKLGGPSSRNLVQDWKKFLQEAFHF